MPEPGKIELQIATTGGDAAAAELNKVAAAAKDATAEVAASAPAPPKLEPFDNSDMNERIEALKKRAAAAGEEAEAIRKMGEEAEKSAPKKL